MISCQYRSPINYSFDAIAQCKASLERLYTCRDNLDFALKNAKDEAREKDAEIIALIDGKKDKFIEAMEDDLNTGEALGAVFELVKDINTNVFDELMDVLGLLYNRKASSSLDDEIEALIQQRNDARKNKNWAEADRIRDELKAQGIVLEDTPQGVKWHRA